jgi:hypothetical protein
LRAIIIACLFFVACGPQEVPDACGAGLVPFAGPPETARSVTFWPGEDPDLPLRAVQSGCGLWDVEGVRCLPAADDAHAQVHVVPNHDPCVETPSGTYVLATTGAYGVITVRIECVRERFETEDDGRPSEQVLKLVLGHEFGHAFGMNWHVPATCDPQAAKSDFERDLVARGICGEALMNPRLDLNACFVTALDGEAYALRDPARSTSGIVADDLPDGGCVLSVPSAP